MIPQGHGMPDSTSSSDRPRRIVFAVLAVMPLFAWMILLAVSAPDLQSWLEWQTRAWRRSDTFEFVNGVALPFTCALAIFSIVSAAMFLANRWREQIPLYAGPVGTLAVCVAIEDLRDPNVSQLMAVTVISMGVSVAVTLIWIVQQKWRARAAPLPLL